MADNSKRPTAKIINPGLGDIEKVRDILFGKYVENFEQQFSELEECLKVDIAQLKQRLSDKITDMDDTVRKSLERLDKQIAGEQIKRDKEVCALQKALNTADKALKHSISEMEDQANQDLVAARSALEESHQELIDSTVAAQAALAKQLEKQKEDLEQDKVGRQALALMLDEVAVKLRTC